MRISLILVPVLMLSGARMFAQQSTAQASHSEKTPASSISDARLLDSLSAQSPVANGSEANANGRLQVRGPVADLFHARSVSDFSGRLAHLANPLAKSEPKPEIEYSGSLKRVSPRAWTTIVGWSPGSSAFPDPVSHEPTMTFLTIGRSK